MWWCRMHRRRGMLRKFPVLHGTGRLSFVQILLLLWFQRASGVLLHGGRLPFVRQLLLRRRILAHQRRPVWRWSATIDFRWIGRRMWDSSGVPGLIARRRRVAARGSGSGGCVRGAAAMCCGLSLAAGPDAPLASAA